MLLLELWSFLFSICITHSSYHLNSGSKFPQSVGFHVDADTEHRYLSLSARSNFPASLKGMSPWTRALYMSLAALLATLPLICWQIYLIHQLLFLWGNFFTPELLRMFVPANISRIFFGHIFQNAVFMHDLSIQKFLEASQVKQINRKSFHLLETKAILIQCLTILFNYLKICHIFDNLSLHTKAKQRSTLSIIIYFIPCHWSTFPFVDLLTEDFQCQLKLFQPIDLIMLRFFSVPLSNV